MPICSPVGPMCCSWRLKAVSTPAGESRTSPSSGVRIIICCKRGHRVRSMDESSPRLHSVGNSDSHFSSESRIHFGVTRFRLQELPPLEKEFPKVVLLPGLSVCLSISLAIMTNSSQRRNTGFAEPIKCASRNHRVVEGHVLLSLCCV